MISTILFFSFFSFSDSGQISNMTLENRRQFCVDFFEEIALDRIYKIDAQKIYTLITTYPSLINAKKPPIGDDLDAKTASGTDDRPSNEIAYSADSLRKLSKPSLFSLLEFPENFDAIKLHSRGIKNDCSRRKERYQCSKAHSEFANYLEKPENIEAFMQTLAYFEKYRSPLETKFTLLKLSCPSRSTLFYSPEEVTFICPDNEDFSENLKSMVNQCANHDFFWEDSFDLPDYGIDPFYELLDRAEL